MNEDIRQPSNISDKLLSYIQNPDSKKAEEARDALKLLKNKNIALLSEVFLYAYQDPKFHASLPELRRGPYGQHLQTLANFMTALEQLSPSTNWRNVWPEERQGHILEEVFRRCDYDEKNVRSKSYLSKRNYLREFRDSPLTMSKAMYEALIRGVKELEEIQKGIRENRLFSIEALNEYMGAQARKGGLSPLQGLINYIKPQKVNIPELVEEYRVNIEDHLEKAIEAFKQFTQSEPCLALCAEFARTKKKTVRAV